MVEGGSRAGVAIELLSKGLGGGGGGAAHPHLLAGVGRAERLVFGAQEESNQTEELR